MKDRYSCANHNDAEFAHSASKGDAVQLCSVTYDPVYNFAHFFLLLAHCLQAQDYFAQFFLLLAHCLQAQVDCAHFFCSSRIVYKRRIIRSAIRQ